MPSCGFAVLGPLAVSADGAEIPLSSVLHRSVLAMLLLHANRPVSADALAEAIWDDDPPGQAGARG
jgi:SARP family transcriptional regulator, regulator of embCAB operon